MRLTPAERRRSQRIHVQIPMFVRGVDAAGVEFIDLTKTLDISSTGAYLASPRLLRSDQILNLTIPAPPSPSSTFPAETPPIQARVRRSPRLTERNSSGGVEFVNSVGLRREMFSMIIKYPNIPKQCAKVCVPLAVAGFRVSGGLEEILLLM